MMTIYSNKYYNFCLKIDPLHVCEIDVYNMSWLHLHTACFCTYTQPASAPTHSLLLHLHNLRYLLYSTLYPPPGLPFVKRALMCYSYEQTNTTSHLMINIYLGPSIRELLFSKDNFGRVKNSCRLSTKYLQHTF